ncbi:MAG: acyl carrier protein [Pseudomonadota bacterium]
MRPTDADLIDLIAEQALMNDKSVLKRDAVLSSIGIDSVDVVSILFALEDKYNVRLETDDIAWDKTLGELFDLVIAKYDALPAASA